ncbi:hypothetical protein BJ322DRAFT_1084922 [Thelephora terrestris]|uniref:Phosphoglycerate mutase family protein n=1 Tax=Thelephora terrestris TaxID=56493 RepID=A0A9P6L2Q1_9AGAM|nr:hypothetical protein BJ322DRAFT_1084922 [Thelephora terrestris]
MGLFHHESDESQAFNEFGQAKHKSEVSHELLSGAAAFAAAHEYEKYCERNGKPQSHAKAKELLAGFSAAFIDHEVESRGLDFIDKQKAKHEAEKRAKERYDVVEVDEYN